MKRIIISFIIVFFINFAYGHVKQNTFYINNIKSEAKPFTGEKRNIDLVLLGKIWGFLKYYHPAVTQGKFDWDAELIKFLPEFLATPNVIERNKAIDKWIDGLGPITPFAKTDSTIAEIKLKPMFGWISHSGLSDKTISKLVQLQDNHNKGNQYYVEFLSEDNIDLSVFSHEKNYEATSDISLELRLVSIYKFWNLIEYWYPYKYLIKGGWDPQLKRFVDQALSIKNEREYCRLIQEMIASINDTHAGVLSSQIEEANGKYDLPFKIKYIGEMPVVYYVNTQLIHDQSIKIGNVLRSVNGIAVTEFFKKNRKYISASNNASLRREIAKIMTRVQDTTARVAITDNEGVEHDILVKTKKHNSIAKNNVIDFPYQRDSTYFFIRPDILYVNIGTLKRSQIASLKRCLPSAKGIIFDNRQYPSQPAGDLISEFILPHKTALVKFSSPVKGYPGTFSLRPPMIIGTENPGYFKGVVTILVNEETQSTGEFLTMAFRLAPKATIIGSTTAGADGNVSSLIPLPGRYFTQFTALGVYYPQGRETQQIGILPDIKVSQTIEGLRTGNDELLQKAISVINNYKESK